MNRLVRLIGGAVLAMASAFFLLNASYAFLGHLSDGDYHDLIPALSLGGLGFLGLLAGTRVAIRAIFPGFTFTRLIVVVLIIAAALHMGGYFSLENESVHNIAQSFRERMRLFNHAGNANFLEQLGDYLKEDSSADEEDVLKYLPRRHAGSHRQR